MFNALINNDRLFLWGITAFFYLLGAFIAYFTTRSRKTLYRIPYLFIYSTILVVFALLLYAIQIFTMKMLISVYSSGMAIIESNLIILSSILPLCAIALLGFFSMRISVPRAYDGFGSKKAAWLLIVPIFFYGLFIVTLDDDPDDQEIPIERDPIKTPAYMNSVKGLVFGCILYCFGSGMFIYISQ